VDLRHAVIPVARLAPVVRAQVAKADRIEVVRVVRVVQEAHAQEGLRVLVREVRVAVVQADLAEAVLRQGAVLLALAEAVLRQGAVLQALAEAVHRRAVAPDRVVALAAQVALVLEVQAALAARAEVVRREVPVLLAPAEAVLVARVRVAHLSRAVPVLRVVLVRRRQAVQADPAGLAAVDPPAEAAPAAPAVHRSARGRPADRAVDRPVDCNLSRARSSLSAQTGSLQGT